VALKSQKLKTNTLSLAEARRLAIAAQGFGNKGPLLKTIKQIGLLQLDSVNVLVRSHYLPLFSRLGPYDTAALDKLSQRGPRQLFEYWGHEASLIPIAYHPLFRWRMEEARAAKRSWAGAARLARERPGFIQAVMDEIAARGPIGAGELSEGGKSTGNWWGWSDGKRALEYLFRTGELTAAGRRGFERLYCLPERVIPDAIRNAPTPSREVAQRELLRMAARAHGVATEFDLRDYFRLPVAETKARLRELLDAGELTEVAVENWNHKAYMPSGAKIPRAVEASALLSPFDSLIWMRPRTERLFGFHYRLAFYTPKHKRTQGYYVMPFLHGDRLVARVDLKADRKQSRLLMLGGHAEPGIDPASIAPALNEQLRSMAEWLDLDRVTLKSRTELATALRRC
jgi:uncharacterized protein